MVKRGLRALNRVAKSDIEEVRISAANYVFTYHGHPLTVMNNSAW